MTSGLIAAAVGELPAEARRVLLDLKRATMSEALQSLLGS